MNIPSSAQPKLKVRLYLTRSDPRVLIGERESHRQVYCERLYGHFQVRGASPLQQWLIDTGSTMAVFPKRVWDQFCTQIYWLNSAGGQLPDWLTKIRGLTGGAIRCRLGVVEVLFRDLENHSIGPVPIVAKFAEDNNTLRESLFGFGGDTLAGRGLHIQYDQNTAWLVQH